MSKPILYSYFRSSTSWRVRIALAHKGIDYEYRPVHLYKDGGEQHFDWYKPLNGMEQIPTLVIDGFTLNQSLPIIEYLDETRPHKPLLPKDPLKRQQVRHIAEIVNSGIQPLMNPTVQARVTTLVGEEKKIEWVRTFLNHGLQAIETVLKSTAGKYCVGDEVTMADLCIIPVVYGGADKFGVDMNNYPTVKRVAEACMQLDAFKIGDYSRQPDTPADLRKP